MLTCLQRHIADILRSKFGDFKTFDSLLYTCAAEFDFLELSASINISIYIFFAK